LLRRSKFEAVTEAEAMVRVELAVPLPGVITAGENEQLRVLGTPSHDSEIVLLNDPDCGFALTVSVPDSPGVIESELGDALNAIVAGADPGAVDAQLGL